MSSRRGDNWLAGVEAILRSKTRDLRKLADLAGLDPVTMYIGTRMDGADLRGQDLRGIKFTHLDRAKVRIDDRTQFDDDAPADPVLPRGLIAFVDEEMEAAYRARSTKLPFDFDSYGPDRIDQFFSACDLFDGPKLIVDKMGSNGRPSRWFHFAGKQLHGAIVVLVTAARPQVLEEAARFAQDSISSPTVLLAQPISVAGPRRDPSPPPVLRDMLGLAVSDWVNFSKTAKMRGVSLFVTARRETGGDIESAWFNLYGKVLKLGLFPYDADRVEVGATWRRGIYAPELLLPNSNVMLVDVRGGWPNLDAGLLMSAQFNRPSTADFDYGQVVRRLLEYNGWQVTSSPPPGGAFHREGDFHAVGRRFAMDVEVRLPRRRGPTALFDLPSDLTINTANGLIVSETAEPGPILETLHREGKLLVNLQDLRWLDVEAASLWTIVSQQARRLFRGLGGRARSIYFGALARSAIDLNRVDTPVRGDFMSRLGLVENWVIDIAAHSDHHLVLEIYPWSDPDEPQYAAEPFLLGLYPEGPSIHFPSERSYHDGEA